MLDDNEKKQIRKQITELRIMYTAYSNRDDVQRQRDAADTIERLLFLVDALELSNQALRREI